MQEAARELALAKQSEARFAVDAQLLRDELAKAEACHAQAAQENAMLRQRLAENDAPGRQADSHPLCGKCT